MFVAPFAGAEEKRVPWTTSKFQGTPEPPSPYLTERIFPGLTFEKPVEAVMIPGTTWMAVMQETAKVFVFDTASSEPQAELFADLRELDPEGNRSYSIAFHPKFAENRLAYVWLNLDAKGERNRENGTHIIRCKVKDTKPPTLDTTNPEVILMWRSGGHNGGNLRFGPDGYLYIPTGDSAGPDPPDSFVTGQDIGDLLSSVLRIDVDRPSGDLAYSIPADNPFVKMPGARGEVWSYGVRNPWRIAFDPKSGELYCGDVGWELWEAIHRIVPGGNSGWSLTEMSRQDVRPDRLRGPTPVRPPLVAHSHEEAASITGGEFYHGDRLPDLKGAYLYADYQMGIFWELRAEGDKVTKHRELCRTPLMPAGFGTLPDGELVICDHSGGGLWRLAKNPAVGRKNEFPRKLSESGLFTDVASQKPAPGVYPYEINAPRWADHATGERWVAFPENGSAYVAAESVGVVLRNRWAFSTGAVLAKTYSMEMERGNPASRRKIETQILHNDGVLWGAYSYRWNADQTDAELVPAKGANEKLSVKDPDAPGGVREQEWRFFSRAECLRCHSMWNSFAPGFSAPQLDRVTASAPGRQSDVFARLGLVPEQPVMADPHGGRGSLEVRVRSYFHSNCGTCHRYNGGGTVPIYLNIDEVLKDTKIVDSKPVQGDLGLPDGRVIAKGDPLRSVLLYRMATAGRGHMPYLGGNLVDDAGLKLVRDWIVSLAPPKAPPLSPERQTIQDNLEKLKAGDLSVVDSLLATPAGALGAALAIVDGGLKPGVRAECVKRGAALADPARRDLFERFLPESQRRRVLGVDIDTAALLSLKGDAARGKTVFGAVCVACHKIGDTGIEFGPDLSKIGEKWKTGGDLLKQILTPSQVVEPQWRFSTLELEKGDPKAGFIAAQTDAEITLKMPGGVTEKIPAASVRKTVSSPISIMPEGMLQNLTAQEAADLLTYLGSLK